MFLIVGPLYARVLTEIYLLDLSPNQERVAEVQNATRTGLLWVSPELDGRAPRYGIGFFGGFLLSTTIV